jgi:hypothetical protein
VSGPPLSKAQYLDRESKASGGLERVLNETQLKKTQARRFLVPYRLLKGAGLTLPEGEDFWVLGEALGRSGIQKFIQLEVDPKTLDIKSYDRKNLGLVLNDLYGPKKGTKRDVSAKVLTDTRELSRLAKVLGSEKAAAVLHRGSSLGEAELYVDSREESLKRLSRVTKELSALVKKLTSGKKNSESTRLAHLQKQLDAAAKEFIAKERE